MPRYPRVFVPDLALHVVQRGHDRQPVFIQDSDFRYFLGNLADVKKELEIRLLGYCLMTNHVHLILMPGENVQAVSKLMRVLAARQTRRVNKLEKRSGTLWDGRFKASLVATDEYLLSCCRYVDLNPVRAAIVAEPQEYEWSGYRGRTGMQGDSVLDKHSVFEALGRSPETRALAYRHFVENGTSDRELSIIRQALQRNQVTGNTRFKAEIEARIGRRLSDKPQGRPRRRS